jgi:UDP-N-acetylmuramoyl-tripeptide--D-alanyl-D-alanine ligase
MRFHASDIARLVDGILLGPDAEVVGASADSRELRPGQLFVPVVAERDGHDFIEAAMAAGASAYLLARWGPRPDRGGTAIEVEHTLRALTVLAQSARSRLGSRVVGITGSVGKTTVKDLVASVLATTYRTAASVRSHNNELGVPLTLVNAPDDAEAAVVEMGARGVGHIRHLCEIATPTIGVVTTVGLAHSELFGGLARIVEAKGELVEALPPVGTAVLNADHPSVAAMAARTSAPVLTFGIEQSADVTATAVEVDAHLAPRFVLETPNGRVAVAMAARGHHQVANALAAATAALAAGVDLDAIAHGLGRAEISPLRMDLQALPGGAQILNDSYNANPVSMEAALRALAHLDADRHRAVLGTMAELGDESVDAHRRIAATAAALGVEIIAVAAPEYGPGAHHVGGIDEALERVGRLTPRDALLVKASRVAGLERLVERLVAAAQGG